MYITINDIIGSRTINLFYPIKGKEIAVVSMFSNNVLYWLQGPIEVLLETGKKIVLNKGVYTDKGLNLLIGTKLKLRMEDHDNVLRTSKLEKVMKMAISLNKRNNSDNLEDGKPSNTLFTYYVTCPEYSTCFESHTPQYKALKNGMITSLTLAITNLCYFAKSRNCEITKSEISNYNSCFKTSNKQVWFLGHGKYMLVMRLLVASGCHIASCELICECK